MTLILRDPDLYHFVSRINPVLINIKTSMKHNTKFPYWNPYIVGVCIGIVIVLSFVITGRGLGAIGAFSSFVASVIKGIAPEHAMNNPIYSEYLSSGHPLKDWVVIEIAGVCLGGFISGLLSGRLKFEVIKGPHISSANRLILAFTGGMLMAFAAKVTRGCTSGLAISGGMLLAPAAFLFIMGMFASGILTALIIYRKRY